MQGASDRAGIADTTWRERHVGMAHPRRRSRMSAWTGGWDIIQTHGRISSTLVSKAGASNHSTTHPRSGAATLHPHQRIIAEARRSLPHRDYTVAEPGRKVPAGLELGYAKREGLYRKRPMRQTPVCRDECGRWSAGGVRTCAVL